ncbi:phenolpthiocerol synthesis polyketide synthase ppsA [Westerdykella ornata]|uniref:Phenolpthiocerol synthesis polyketide synthase ppsA n=1 Tax=Westerdykella ornata TaxID=318751 RepID=A0A6A6JT38_WESOR|nr:phenolpthiocerol synthesis polyketide synthase ppsA [Westerdykella ornata]KAF2279780.1 phenolpthiocerol synthesis polyketide synthase ppsA [Westerdykella ornata]
MVLHPVETHGHGDAGVDLSAEELGGTPEPIAIIGMACRFPQDATSPSEFWKLLEEGRSTRTKVPSGRFNVDAFPTTAKAGHFLSGDLAAFDASFFAVPKHEADALDPQQRGLLECTYHALENSGIPLETVTGSKTGVFVGCMGREYDWTLARDPDSQHQYHAVGSGSAMLSNRLSWFYDFKGPSVTIDTACSSSLVALHLACQSLQSGDSSMTVVGGANIMINPDVWIAMSSLNFLSPDGHCYSFDHRANGYSRGEGFGVIILKTLSQAIQDKDTVRAVIRATHCNQDGNTPGITNPNKDAQVALIREAYAKAGLSLDDTRFFEAHGTGTQAGDTTEAAAIQEVFGKVRDTQDPIIIGALKSNIGHLEGASGVASVIKTVLALEKGIIPPNANFEKANPRIPVDEWCVKFPVVPQTWPSPGLRRASLNSFGYGGSNAHAILDDAYHYMTKNGIKYRHNTQFEQTKQTFVNGTSGTLGELCEDTARNNGLSAHEPDLAVPSPKQTREATQPTSSSSNRSKAPHTQTNGLNGIVRGVRAGNHFVHDRQFLWPLSTFDEPSMQNLVQGLQVVCEKDSKLSTKEFIVDMAYTLASKRNKLRYRSFCLVDEELGNLQEFSQAWSQPVRTTGRVPKVAFVFTGQGAAWWDMGKELLHESIYKDSITESNRILRNMGCEWDLLEELTRGEENSRILEAQISQPATTALQIALVNLLRSWNITPSAVVGHSSGEIGAAYCAGALSHRAALQVAFYRGKVSAELYRGWNGPAEGMMVVALSLKEVENLISSYRDKGQICVACVNSPKHITLAGSSAGLDALRRDLEAEGVFAKELRVDIAYHSPTMERISKKYLSHLEGLSGVNDPMTTQTTPVFSSVTGKQVSIEELQCGEYWVTNMVSKVQFSAALLAMREGIEASAQDWIVEIGPTNALRRPILETLEEVHYAPCLRCEISAYQTMLTLAGNLWCHNVPVDLIAMNGIDSSRANMLAHLPQYPFNHTRKFWHESRMNKNIRFRQYPRCNILGSQDPYFNPLDAKWRNTIRIQELPWIEDHKINGSVLLPASGMVFMAVEAARQLAATAAELISGFRINDLLISRALIFPADVDTVQTEISLQRERTGSNKTSWRFRVFGLENDQWMEACRGSVVVEFETEELKDGFEHDHELQFARRARLQGHQQTASECGRTVLVKHMYDNLEKYGYSFGSSFRSLSQIHFSEYGQATATVDLQPWRGRPDLPRQYLLHPIPLDAMFQLPLVAVSKGSWQAIPTMIPNGVRDLWLSAKLLDQENTDIFLTTTSVQTGSRNFDFTITASTSAGGELLATFDGYHCAAISTLKAHESSEWRRICFQESWKLDVSSASLQSLANYCNTRAMPLLQLVDATVVDDAELVCLHFMARSLELAEATRSKLPHIHKYTEWMKHHLKTEAVQRYLGARGMTDLLGENSPKAAIVSCVEDSGPEGKVYTTVGSELPRIIRGEVDVIDLLFGGDLLQSFYSGPSFLANYEKMSAYLDLLAHKTPAMSILEIGAGTGGATAAIMKTIGQDPCDPHSTPKYHAYDYTDISPGFFEAAKERFQHFSDRMSFKTLDIEKSPSDQGFIVGAYDVIIASCVLHATSNISNTLRNTRSLLKPSGKLILFEPTEPMSTRLPFVFGLLEGWWLAEEDSRRWSPLLTDTDWDAVLRQNGFSGADLCLKDFDDGSHTFSVIVSTAVDPSPVLPNTPSCSPHGVVIVDPDSKVQISIAEEIRQHGAWEILPLEAMEDKVLEHRITVLLFELGNPALHRLSPETFLSLKYAVNKMRRVVWVTGESTLDPLAGVTTGFARTLTSEIATLTLTTLSLENFGNAAMAAEQILKICNAPTNELEQEFAECNGELHINRIVECNFLSDRISHATVPQPPSKVTLGSKRDRALTLLSDTDGFNSKFHFVEDLDDRLVESDGVEVVVKAVGIHRTTNGSIASHQCAGVVSRVGSEFPRENIQVGDRVCCLAKNAFTTIIRSRDIIIHKIPSTMSFEEAASVPVAWCTAYYSLIQLAQLRQGETVLIHDATSAIGSAALQLAKLKDANVIVTVECKEAQSWLIEEYGLDENNILSSRNAAFEHGIHRITRAQGVDIVLGLPSKGSLGPSMRCLAPFGRFIDVSGDSTLERNDCYPISENNISVFRVNLLDMLDKAKNLAQRILEEGLNAYKACRRPFVTQRIKSFTASQLEDAFRCLNGGNFFSFVVIRLEDEDVVPVVASPKAKWKFSPAATYVIAGGTGGLGRSITRWMMDRGARYIVLLGRSGAQSESIAILIAEAKRRGVEVKAPACNITIMNALEEVIRDCSQSMPPIKGCIQASMVLRDSLFENMDYGMFKGALEPKVHGTINLQKTMPTDMDFFLLLSSTTGIFGSRGQSNYAGSSTFQNAFAKHLVAQGQKCLSIDLGLMLGVGYAAERQHITDSFRASGYEGISESEFHALLEWACDPGLELTAGNAHIITGISTPASVAAKGLDEIFWMRKPIFRGLSEMDRSQSTQTSAFKDTVDYRALVRQAASHKEAGQIISNGLVEKLSKALGMPTSDFDVARPIHTYGVDSLVSVEIRYWCRKEFEAEIAVFEILQSKSLEELCLMVATKSELVGMSDKNTATVQMDR